MNKLLRPFTGTGSVFFPIGRPSVGGTCGYATAKCLDTCYVNDPSDFDEETRIPDCGKRETYRLIMEEPLEVVVRQMLIDLDGLQTHILSWFGSGDCLAKDTSHISAIIQTIPPHIVQMGFTRNQTLWRLHKDVFALTIEKESDAPDHYAMYSVPDYANETSVMFSPRYDVRGGFCGPHLCMDQERGRPELTHYINCKICHRLSMGCFDRRDYDV